MLVSLLRAHTLGAYGFGGGYEPGMSSDTGFQLGRERTHALCAWSRTRPTGEPPEFSATDGNSTIPCVCRPVLPHEGPLPKSWGLVEVSSPDVVVSSVKPTRDGEVALRVYEAAGRAAPGVSIKLERQDHRGARGQPAGRRRRCNHSRRRFGTLRSAAVRDQDDSAAAGGFVGVRRGELCASVAFADSAIAAAEFEPAPESFPLILPHSYLSPSGFRLPATTSASCRSVRPIRGDTGRRTTMTRSSATGPAGPGLQW